MEQKTLAVWLKSIIVGVGICGIIIVGLIIPITGTGTSYFPTEYENGFLEWMILLFMVMIPVYIALAFAWELASNIQKDNSFSKENARYLKIISYLAAGDTALFFMGNVFLFFMGFNDLSLFLFTLLADFAGVCIAVCAAALSHLTMKSALLQEQSDLTI